MNIQVTWDNPEKTIVRWDFAPNWKWQDFHASVDQSEKMAEEVDHPVDLILNMVDTPIIPQDGIAIRHIKRGMTAATSQDGIVVITGRNFLAQTFVFIFQKVYAKMGQSFFLADTVEEAREVIAKHREYD